MLFLLVLLCATPDAGVKELLAKDFYTQALKDPAPRQVTAEQLSQWLKDGSVVLVDLRSKEQFAQKHLHGAINLPVTELTDAVVSKLLPRKDVRIVTYCDDQLFPTRRIALTTLGVPSLRRLGYTDVALLENLWMRRDAGALVFDER